MILSDEWSVKLYSCCTWMFRIEGTAHPIAYPANDPNCRNNTMRSCPECGTRIPIPGAPVEVDIGIAKLEKIDPAGVCKVCGLYLLDTGPDHIGGPSVLSCPIGCEAVK